MRQGTHGLLVSIVDDDPSIRRALARLVRTAGFSAAPFASAEEFLDSAERDQTECLLLDIRLHGMSGFALVRRLDDLGVSIPTILITAHDDASTCQRALRAGALDYLRKPFDEQLVLSAVQKAVAARGRTC